MEATTQQLDLTQFLAKEDGEYTISRPHVIDGWRYFTDGRVCVRVRDESAPNTTDGSFPPSDKIFPTKTLTDWQPWPTDSFIEAEGDCLVCEGRGRVGTTTCATCKGNQEVVCEACGHEHECDDCNGLGYGGGTTCRSCRGKQRVTRPVRQTIAGVSFNYEYVAKILSLPNPQYSRSSVRPGKALAFRFDGGEGVLMPLSN
jgi:hypothetical protein